MSNNYRPHPKEGQGGCIPPSQVHAGGYPLPRQGGTHSQVGDTPSQAGGSTPFQGRGVPSSQVGGTLFPDRGYPPHRQGEGYPLPEQHNVYLLRGGRYASWVHAIGLSCCNNKCIPWNIFLEMLITMTRFISCKCFFLFNFVFKARLKLSSQQQTILSESELGYFPHGRSGSLVDRQILPDLWKILLVDMTLSCWKHRLLVCTLFRPSCLAYL